MELEIEVRKMMQRGINFYLLNSFLRSCVKHQINIYPNLTLDRRLQFLKYLIFEPFSKLLKGEIAFQ